MDAAISVILPVYNGEKFLRNAVESVLSQTVSDWELLIVENGSTDGTTAVAEEFLCDPRIRLLHSEKGVSNARNMGLTQARGKWILFLDADDVFTENAMEALVNAGSGVGADIIIGQYARKNRTYSGETVIYQGKEGIAKILCKCLNEPTQFCTSTAVLFSRELIRDNNISFDKELSYAEDSVFFLQTLQKASIVVQTESAIYRVGYNRNSAIHGKDENRFLKYKKSIVKIESSMENETEEIQRSVAAFVLCQVLVIFVNNTFLPNKKIREQVQDAKGILRDPIVKTALNRVDLATCEKKKKVAFYFMREMNMPMIYLIVKIRQFVNEKKIKEDSL